MERKPRVGRPPRSARGRRVDISVRISPEAAEALARTMAMAGLGRSDAIDAALLAFAPPDRDGLGTIPLDLGLALPPPPTAAGAVTA